MNYLAKMRKLFNHSFDKDTYKREREREREKERKKERERKIKRFNLLTV